MKNIEMRVMDNKSNIKLYDIFRKDLRLPGEKVQEFVQAIDETARICLNSNLQDVVTKQFVKEEVFATKEFLRDEIFATKEFVKNEISATKEFVKEEIFTTKEFVKDEIRVAKDFVKEEIFATKQLLKEEIHKVDLRIEQTKEELTKAIYKVGYIQFITTMAAIWGIIKFMSGK
jgi:hypothetical protein